MSEPEPTAAEIVSLPRAAGLAPYAGHIDGALHADVAAEVANGGPGFGDPKCDAAMKALTDSLRGHPERYEEFAHEIMRSRNS